ncbi:hypothetical protein CR194_18500 [Salipaludibacillus keqinensis]|uniref:Uncharacterized protein n=1 Tax=Salipaludibacillus keqinensis TaxID=2045207 RepID=A0A323TAP5_9BACI|nr:hypothetical protein [Salipaludibacillus keqinensis]PYZ91624.1 hypothetical protein CR194_18500 [Salipaludibacillus keqinensis]
MVRHSSPFSGRYSRYVLSILIFAVLTPIIMWESNIMYSVISIVIAALLTVGYDVLTRQIAIRKAEKMVNEQSSLIVHAVKRSSERKGYLVLTDRFVVFVPLWKKIKTVLDTEQVVRHEFDGQLIEITVRFPNKHRTFRFFVSSPEKVKLMLDAKSGESLPYKYDKMEKNKTDKKHRTAD